MGKILMIIPLAVMAVEPVLVGQSMTTAEPTEIMSPGGEYSLSFEYGRGNTEYVTIERFTVRTKTDALVYEKTQTKHTLLDISDNGIVVGIDYDGPVSGKARLHFYDAKGQEVGTALIGFLLERMFSHGGSVYCVNDGTEGVRVFRSDGIELYRLSTCNKIAVSPDGSCIAVARDDGIHVYENGERTNTFILTSPFVRQMKFSQDNNLFGFITSKTFTMYDLSEHTHLFEYEAQPGDRYFISFDILHDNSGFVCGLDVDGGRGIPDRHTKGYLYVIDDHGTLLWQDEMQYDKWNIHVPSVQVESENEFTVSTIDQVYYYEY
ncbi:MAG: hypothetical protein JSW02_08835 [candidate division WOR-3 bacterium]|nr:MAG: hypothetical protein JSW02_08835 [candidate division WOR-3 bacterium]